MSNAIIYLLALIGWAICSIIMALLMRWGIIDSSESHDPKNELGAKGAIALAPIMLPLYILFGICVGLSKVADRIIDK